VIGVAVPGAVLSGFPSGTGYAAAGYRTMGAILGVGMVVVAIVTGLGVRERSAPEDTAEAFSWRGFLAGLVETMRNPAFRVLIVTFVFILLGGSLYQTLVPYAFRYWIQRPDLVSNIPLVYIAASVLSLPIWTRLANVLGKDRAMRACIVWALVALGVTPLVLGPEAGQGTTFAFVGLAGLGNGGWIVLPVAITADVVDWDELHTHHRREGAYFGVWTMVMKFADAIAAGIIGVSLQLFGYVPNAEQSATTILGIKLLYGPIPALCMLAALFTFRRFPLTRAQHQEVQMTLAARRRR
jgi:GPH family glycoside/pentoside/hexuronide:cation symporter